MSSTQIYEQHYRRLDASIPLRTQRWIPIAREGLKALIGFRAYLALISIAWLPVFGRLVQVYFTTRFPEARRIVPVDDKFFFEACLYPQFVFMYLMAAYAGAGLIANDMRTGGLLLYLSRPLTLGDYILGKFSILFVSLSMVTLVPNLALFLGARSLAPDVLGDVSHLILMPKIIAFSLILILPTAALVLVVSALARNPRFAGLGFFFVLVGSNVAQQIGWRATRSPFAGLISVDASMRRVGEWIFGVKPTRMTADLPPEYAFAILAVLLVSCILVLKTRVRAVEIVK
jgi:ABC-type transport system involved in multi-copper enzyme maturation permease subunit